MWAVFLDLTKAFDTVDNGILLRQLSEIGLHVCENSLQWFHSNITDRKQRTCCGNELSVTHRVPQGSILGSPVICHLHQRLNCQAF